ncbi:MAG TPA: hypothetical protein PLI68_00655 [Bacteroidia bacterium]|nr:hypothetical protein [Bacteroidia bacterium]
MINKKELHKVCFQKLNDKIQFIESALLDLKSANQNDSKSSAGDKHETAGAMLHLEQEKLSRQLGELLVQKKQFQQLQPEFQSEQVLHGSLIECKEGWIYISIALGNIVYLSTNVSVISTDSPLAKALFGAKKGDILTVNNRTFHLLQVQ